MLRSTLRLKGRARETQCSQITRCTISRNDSNDDQRWNVSRSVSILKTSSLSYHPSHNLRSLPGLRFLSTSNGDGNGRSITAEDIVDFWTSNGYNPDHLRRTKLQISVKVCPFCHPTKGKADNEYKLFLKVGEGAFYCHRCGAKGSWFEFRKKLGGYEQTKKTDFVSTNRDRSANSLRETEHNKPIGPLPMPEHRINSLYMNKLLLDENKEALQYLTEERGIDLKTLKKYGVGVEYFDFKHDEHDGKYLPTQCVIFPWIVPATHVIEEEKKRGVDVTFPAGTTSVNRRFKARAIKSKAMQRICPPGGGWGLFGYHTIPKDATEVVVTEGEYDAMAVNQATGKAAVSLPNGCHSLPQEIMPLLARFEKIYLWMDNDTPGKVGRKHVVKELGIKRCYIVSPSEDPAPKDANEALLKGHDLNKYLENAKKWKHPDITNFAELRTEVINEILNPEAYRGFPMPSLPMLTEIVKGFRLGELTVLTGKTGSGKTTFLSQLSLDMAEQGVDAVWGSFEIKNTRLIKKMMQQYDRKPFDIDASDAVEKINEVADRFQKLPFQFLKKHGSQDIDDVINAMESTISEGSKLFILDNMQFMISRKDSKSSFDKFEIQDKAIEMFRKFSTEHNVHVILVCHPRKGIEGAALGMDSFYGSAKATQEADLVLILQSDGNGRKWVEVKKNRYDGSLGSSPIFFDRASMRYSESASTGAQKGVDPQAQSSVGKHSKPLSYADRMRTASS